MWMSFKPCAMDILSKLRPLCTTSEDWRNEHEFYSRTTARVQTLSMIEPYAANNTSALCKHLQRYANTKCCWLCVQSLILKKDHNVGTVA